ncbi:MAG: LpxI family protein, partial [Alphaproteobacteria bacterium]|nr:LpxI family protein [Alphaproteobacteria bacterium]
MSPTSKLAIIAGGGELPKLLAAACEQQQRPYLLVAVAGEADSGGQDQWFGALPHLNLRLGAAASLLEQLPTAEVQAVVFAGRINRPSLASLKPDWATAKLAMKVGLNSLGDDGLLRALAGLLEDRGITVIGAQDVLADLLVPEGQLGAHPLPAASRPDVSKGLAIAHALSPHDVGHAVVVQQGVVLAMEAAEGTDRMLIRVGALKKPGQAPVLI